MRVAWARGPAPARKRPAFLRQSADVGNSRRNATVSVNASGHASQSLNIQLPRADALEVRLEARAPAGGATPRPASAAPAGTWEIQLNADPNLRRIESGRLVFDPQSDQSIVVAGSLMLDGQLTRLNGIATQAGSRVLLKLDCQSSNQHWSCPGSLERTGARQLRGQLTDRDGKPVPLELRGLN